jgi:Ketopantoate hydroxymethyltransferase
VGEWVSSCFFLSIPQRISQSAWKESSEISAQRLLNCANAQMIHFDGGVESIEIFQFLVRRGGVLWYPCMKVKETMK